MTKQTKRFAIGVACFIAVAILADAIFISQFADRTLETEKARTLIAGKIGRELGGNAGLLPIRSRSFSVVSPGIVATLLSASRPE